MKNIRLFLKLLGGFAIVAAIVVLVSLVGLMGVTRLMSLLATVGKQQLPALTSIQSLRFSMMEMHAAESTLLLREISEPDRAAAYAQFIDAKQSADNARDIYEPIAKTTEEIALWDQFKASWDAWWREHEGFVEREKAFRMAPSDARYEQLAASARDVEAPLFDAAFQILSASAELHGGYASLAVRTGDEISMRVQRVSETGLIAGPLVALLLSLFLSFSVTRPLARGIAFAQNLAAGDFTRRLASDRKDEVGILAQALNTVVEELRTVVTALQGSAEQVASSSTEISCTAIKLAHGAQSQVMSLEETSASVHELSVSVQQVFEHARLQEAAIQNASASTTMMQKSIEDTSRDLDEIAGLAGQSVEKAVNGVEAVQSVVEGIGRISESSQKIAGIVALIADFADQTNLLALNASIEAARAGEHGRGFSVVANEVGKLAGRSSSSVKEIEALIRESAKNVTIGVETAGESQKAMEQIRDASEKVRGMLARLTATMTRQVQTVGEFADAIENVTEMSRNISRETEQQAANARQVSSAAENVNQVTQAAASAAQEISGASELLARMAQGLHRLLGQFKTAAEDTQGPPPANHPHSNEELGLLLVRPDPNGAETPTEKTAVSMRRDRPALRLVKGESHDFR